MLRFRFWTAALVAAVAAIATPAVSEAGFKVQIEVFDSGGSSLGTVNITDNVLNDSNSAADNIGFSNTSLFSAVNLTLTANATEAGSGSLLNQVNTSVSNLTNSAVRVRVTATRTFDLPDGSPNLKLLASTVYNEIGTDGLSFPNSDDGYFAYFDKNGDEFGTDVLIKSQTPTTSASASGGIIKDPGGTWALTEILDFTLAGTTGQVSGLTGTISVTGTSEGPTLDVPAPGGLIMALTAVPFFGVLRRRLRKTEAAA